MGVVETMFCLIRNEITGEALPQNIEYDVEKLIGLSKSHDLSHLVADALIRNGLVTSNNKKYKEILREKLVAVYRDTQRTSFYERVSFLLKQNDISYVPLKGILICELYPESWMRSSCDLDMLIHEYDVEKAREVLTKGGLTTDNRINYHDISFFENKNHLELHFSICENNKQIDKLLKKVWDYTYKKEENEYRETNVFFAFHHIAHMAYHFLAGGCGIRPFLDLWLMRQKHFYNDNDLILLLKECELVPFYNAVCKLSDVWFNNQMHTELTKAMSDYIIFGGVYGNENNSYTVEIAKNKGNRLKYLFKLAFLPYENMCVLYPSLRKHKILLPFCYIHRFFSKLFGKDRKRIKNRVKDINRSSNDKIEEVSLLIKELGLNNTSNQ